MVVSDAEILADGTLFSKPTLTISCNITAPYEHDVRHVHFVRFAV